MGRESYKDFFSLECKNCFTGLFCFSFFKLKLFSLTPALKPQDARGVLYPDMPAGH